MSKKNKEKPSPAEPSWMRMYHVYATPAAMAVGLMAMAVAMSNGRRQQEMFLELKAGQREVSESAKQGTLNVVEQTKKTQAELSRAQAELTDSIRREIKAEVAKADYRTALQNQIGIANAANADTSGRVTALEGLFHLLTPFVFHSPKEGTTGYIKRSQLGALQSFAGTAGYTVETTELKKTPSRHPAFVPPGPPEEWVQATVRPIQGAPPGKSPKH